MVNHRPSESERYRHFLRLSDRAGGQSSGVIAVLFLFVVGFIFAAISVSMQVGQVVERRITTDLSADSAAYAMASKTAQGLNFIAANNLAIAGASHMAGVVHLAADRIILVKAFFQAKSFFDGGSPKLTSNDMAAYDQVYRWFRPVAGIYFRSAIGLTKLNSAIRASFPYLGLMDAIAVGSANVPSSMIVPFGWKRDAAASATDPAGKSDGAFSTVFMERLKKTITGMSLKYEGLSRTYADETFCLAYETGKNVMSEKDHSQLGSWLTGVKFPILNAIGDVLSVAANIVQKLGVLQGWVGIKVGFAGCGFGERGEALTAQNPNIVKNFIGQFLLSVVKGPLSGRPTPVDMSRPNANILYPGDSADTLESLVNTKADIAKLCAINRAGLWRTAELASAVDVRSGACLTPTNRLRKYPANSSSFEPGIPFTPGSPLGANQVDLFDYDVACHGTILFRWGAYSGLNLLPNPANPSTPKVVPAQGSYPGIPLDDQEQDLCPSFKASSTKNITYPEYKFGVSHINMSRGKPFLDEIVSGLINSDILLPPSHWRGADPRPDAMRRIKDLLACATRDPEICPHGYLQNKDGDKFSPDFKTLQWLCPAGGTDDGRMENIRATLKFDRPEAPGRWASSGAEQVPGGGPHAAGKYLNKFIELQSWHNERVNTLVKAMQCEAYENFAKKGIVAVANDEQRVKGSNNYCDSGAHYCWQSSLQKHPDTGPLLEQGGLSFLLKTPSGDGEAEAPLDRSLHYAVMAINPLRTDKLGDIKGRMDQSSLAHCPNDMEINVTLEDNSVVQVCDVQPVIGFISRIIDDGGRRDSVDAKDQFGGGDVNLASGGALGVDQGAVFGTSGFMAIAQSTVKFKDNAPGAPPIPSQPKSKAKNYQMFWPSWHPAIEPSRVMSRVMPPSIARLVED